MKNIIIESLNNLYFCDRVWSAWSYGTMTQEDFIPLNEDDEFLDDFYNFLLKSEKLSEEKIICFLSEQIDVYYNEDLENFKKEDFNEDWLSNFDIEYFFKDINKEVVKEKISLNLKDF